MSNQNDPVKPVKPAKTAAPPKKRKPVALIVIGCAAVFLLCIGSFVVILFIVNSGIFDNGTYLTGYSYSSDQENVIDAFGPPEAFNITFNIEEDGTEKVEVWKFIELDEIFTFNNGNFVERKHYFFDDFDDVEIYNLNLEPDDFYGVETKYDLEEVLETGPSATTTLDESVLNGVTYYYEYGQWLHAVEVDGMIVSIDQKAYIDTTDGASDDEPLGFYQVGN